MERVASGIVTRMITADLIDRNEAASYRYGIQILLEKLISYVVIFGLAIILNSFLEVLLFFISFSVIRKYSGGIHCRHFETCLVASTAVSFSGIALFPLVEKSILTYQGGAIMSIIIVFLIGAVNNPNIDWSNCEYRKVRRLSRLTVVLEASVLMLLLILQSPFVFRFYISYGIVVSAISLLLEIRKKGGIAYEDSREETLETC